MMAFLNHYFPPRAAFTILAMWVFYRWGLHNGRMEYRKVEREPRRGSGTAN